MSAVALLVAVVVFAGCASTAEPPAQVTEPVTAVTSEPPPTTVAPHECAAVFEADWDAYGWERCLLPDDESPWHLDSNSAEAVLASVWARYGAGPMPDVVIVEDFAPDLCAETDEPCQGIASATRHGDGSRYVTLGTHDNISLFAVLHEAAHHIVGVGRDIYAGGHGNDFRCVAVEMYSTYAPEAVPVSVAAGFAEMCGTTAEAVLARHCAADTAGIIRAAELLAAHGTTLSGHRDRQEEIDRLIIGIEASWQGDPDAKAERIEALQAERDEIGRAVVELDEAVRSVPEPDCSAR